MKQFNSHNGMHTVTVDEKPGLGVTFFAGKWKDGSLVKTLADGTQVSLGKVSLSTTIARKTEDAEKFLAEVTKEDVAERIAHEISMNNGRITQKREDIERLENRTALLERA